MYPWSTKVKDRALTDPVIQFAWSCCMYSTKVKDRALTDPVIQFAWSCCMYSTKVKDRALTDQVIQFAWSCCMYSTKVKDRALTTATLYCSYHYVSFIGLRIHAKKKGSGYLRRPSLNKKSGFTKTVSPHLRSLGPSVQRHMACDATST
jgi:hypothetical protein